MFDTIEIDGYHDLNEGFGFDDSILLKRAVRIRLFGLLIIYNNSEILEKNNHGGWIHTNIEMTRYSGWMVNQHNNKHLIMIGECDIIKITTGRI
jgi:hypothetical protein